MKVVLDTSVLLMVKDGFDPIELLTQEYAGDLEFIVPRAVLNEISSKLNSRRFAESSKARVAMEYLKLKSGKVRVVETPQGKTDDVLINLCKAEGAALFTADMRLKERAKREGITVVTPRGRGKTINFQ
ncbi:MAG: PIN domain-containing protein [Thermoprotei archaeon]